ncbi:MAG: PAS domain-containing protein [Alphaproteobacteria bacterium]|nr:MAG: PAS domain-containing protein [Alphaproteobacteria bacterium]
MELTGDPGVKAIREPVSPDEIPWEGGRLLFHWWLETRGARPFPSRAEFDPAILRGHLATVVLHDVESDQERPDFRIRLMGTELVAFTGFDPTGRRLDEVPNTTPIRARYEWLVKTGRPYLGLDIPLGWASKEYISYSTLALPLGDDPGRIDMIMAHLHFERMPGY